jgi:hypothetical protein
VIKTALSEGGWLMQAHTRTTLRSAEPRRCACAYATFSACERVTRNSASSPDGPVRGQWQVVEDTDEICEEIDYYYEVCRLLSIYTLFVRNDMRTALLSLGHDTRTMELLHAQRRLDAVYQDKWDSLDSLDRVIDHLSGVSQMLHGVYKDDQGIVVWRFQSSYLEFSDTNRFSRSWLLLDLVVVVQTVKDVMTKFTGSLQEVNNVKHEKLINKLLAAYETWLTLAAPRVQVSAAALRTREETTGRVFSVCGNRKDDHLSQLLHVLLHV